VQLGDRHGQVPLDDAIHAEQVPQSSGPARRPATLHRIRAVIMPGTYLAARVAKGNVPLISMRLCLSGRPDETPTRLPGTPITMLLLRSEFLRTEPCATSEPPYLMKSDEPRLAILQSALRREPSGSRFSIRRPAAGSAYRPSSRSATRSTSVATTCSRIGTTTSAPELSPSMSSPSAIHVVSRVWRARYRPGSRSWPSRVGAQSAAGARHLPHGGSCGSGCCC
jgi:hypothetical protein